MTDSYEEMKDNHPTNTVRDDFRRVGDEAGRTASHIGREARKGYESARDTMEHGYESAKDTIERGYETARERVAEGYETAKEEVHESIQALSDFMRDRPMMSLGIALGTGVVLGMYFLRPRR